MQAKIPIKNRVLLIYRLGKWAEWAGRVGADSGYLALALAHNKVMSLTDYDIYVYKKAGKIITIIM